MKSYSDLDFEKLMDKQGDIISSMAGLSHKMPESHRIYNFGAGNFEEVRRLRNKMDELQLKIDALQAQVKQLRATKKAKDMLMEITQVKKSLPKVHKFLLLFAPYRKAIEKKYMEVLYWRWMKRFAIEMFEYYKKNPTHNMKKAKIYNINGRINDEDIIHGLLQESRYHFYDKYCKKVEFNESLRRM